MQTNKLFTVFVGSLMLLATFSPAFAMPALSMQPGIGIMRLANGNYSSTNWSGYAVTGASGSVTVASGSWTVPAATAGTSSTTTYYSAFWVGIDGFSSSTVEQTGTISEIQGSIATYYAWYEFYPSPMYEITSMTIRPGDQISATVTYTGTTGRSGFFGRSSSTFSVTITDQTTRKSYTTMGTVANAARSSAEWIAEAPSSYRGVLPLANFGTAAYGYDYTKVANTCYATVNGVNEPINSLASAVQSITMVTNSGATKAAPSALSSDGTSFTVTWANAGP
jgi:hypothetical protein